MVSWLALSPPGKNVQFPGVGGGFLCGGYMFSPCLSGFPPQSKTRSQDFNIQSVASTKQMNNFPSTSRCICDKKFLLLLLKWGCNLLNLATDVKSDGPRLVVLLPRK